MISLRARLKMPGLFVAPGCYDALVGAADRAGRIRGRLSSRARPSPIRGSAARISGLSRFSELADIVAAIRERVAIPLIVDMDTGFGNALNVQRSVKLLAQAGRFGASARRPGDAQALRPSRRQELVSPAARCAGRSRPRSMRGQRRCAADRADRCDRGRRLRRGASIAPKPISPPARTCCSSRRRNRAEQLAAIGERFGGRVPLLANMVEGGKTPLLRRRRTRDARLLASRSSPAARCGRWRIISRDYFASLKAHGTTAPFRDRMLDFKGINDIVGTDAMLEARTSAMSSLDPVTLAVLKGRLEQIADEMDATLFRTGVQSDHRGGARRKPRALSCGNRRDPGAGQGRPADLRRRHGIRRQGGDREVRPCRAISPMATSISSTIPMTAARICPISSWCVRSSANGRVFCWLASVGHWHDVGGNVPGNYNPVATECFQEGMLIPPVKLFAKGELRSDVIDIVTANSRLPNSVYGDLNGQINALDLGIRRLAALLDEFGDATVAAAMAELRARAAQLMRSEYRGAEGRHLFRGGLSRQ